MARQLKCGDVARGDMVRVRGEKRVRYYVRGVWGDSVQLVFSRRRSDGGWTKVYNLIKILTL